MSENADATSAWPFAVSTMRTAVSICSASQTPVAMPQPTSSLPSRIERGSGLRLSQPKASRALPIAFAQLLAGVGFVLVLIAIGIAAQPQLQRIELERDRKLVHRAFQSIDAGRRARRAHVGWRRQIEPRQSVHIFGVRAFVELARPGGVVAGEIFVLRRGRDRLVDDRVERAALFRAERKMLDRGRTIAEPIHLLPGQNQPHRAFERRAASTASAT